MPNWVYNTISVFGKTEDVEKFLAKAGTPFTTEFPNKTYESGETTKTPATQEVNEKFSFWNFIRPTDEELPYYYEWEIKEEDKDDPDATSEERMAKAMTFAGSGWYDWNIRNWGVKWDTSNASIYPEELDKTKPTASVNISFDTAWGVPEPVFRAVIQQHPELDFDFECEEEQGWGVKYTAGDVEEFLAGEERSLITTDEWDIPDCHADYVARGRECVCEYDDDTDCWYTDCPRPEQDYFVVITKTYRLTAASAENAYNLATENNLDEQAETIEDETSIFVADENGERLYPNFGSVDEDEGGLE